MMDQTPYAYLFFIPFILIATYTTLNIFIAIVVNTMNEMHMQDVKEEEDLKSEITLAEHRKSQHQIEMLNRKIDQLIKRLDK